MLTTVRDITENLIEPWKTCIVSLTDQWKERGYSRMHADILYALGGSDLHDAFPPLVECTFHREDGLSPNYRHRLLPLGVEVKNHILGRA